MIEYIIYMGSQFGDTDTISDIDLSQCLISLQIMSKQKHSNM